MGRTFVFNGDADGLCALQQLRLAEGIDAAAFLVSGPKRETALLQKVVASAGDAVTVLDLSFDTNRAAAEALLERGVHLRYFDHHYAGELPRHAQLEAHIDCSPAACTSVIVDRFLGGTHRPWAVAGAYGDNLDETASALAAGGLETSSGESELLRRLGVALNYNSYADTETDMFFAPLALHARLARHADPLSFVHEDSAFGALWDGYCADMERILGLQPAAHNEHAALFVLPDEVWARRVRGVLANRLAREAPRRAHAVLLPNGAGGMSVSVRAALDQPTGAAVLCRSWPTGGGREAAAGINELAMADVGEFTRRFMNHFGQQASAG